jgi:hypothetical protein
MRQPFHSTTLRLVPFKTIPPPRHATRSRLAESRTADGLKAAEMLAKMCGWNEPEKVNVQSVEVKVDAALIEQLRAGYRQLASKGAPLALQERAGGCHPPPARGYGPQIEGPPR